MSQRERKLLTSRDRGNALFCLLLFPFSASLPEYFCGSSSDENRKISEFWWNWGRSCNSKERILNFPLKSSVVVLQWWKPIAIFSSLCPSSLPVSSYRSSDNGAQQRIIKAQAVWTETWEKEILKAIQFWWDDTERTQERQQRVTYGLLDWPASQPFYSCVHVC